MNPVWQGYFADPDVLRTPQGYFAYGTDSPDQPVLSRTGRVFPILHSPDLAHWEPAGGALIPPDGTAGAHFWAPEVIEQQGRYLMYYSAGGEEGEGQRLRLAIAEKPEGPFVDEGHLLLPDEPFSIDASPFVDPVSGRAFLFFAKDFLDGDYPGTGVAIVDLSADLLTVESEPRTLLRPNAGWQVFQRNRFWYGRTWPAWYTVEGPFCVCRDGRYWLFYSGGYWKGEAYGVGVAIAEQVSGPFVDEHASEGACILTSVPGLRGPGHNSIVSDGRGADYIAFHAWDEAYAKRQMYVEPIEWTSGGPRIRG